jgi:hypothetical protein
MGITGIDKAGQKNDLNTFVKQPHDRSPSGDMHAAKLVCEALVAHAEDVENSDAVRMAKLVKIVDLSLSLSIYLMPFLALLQT